MSASRTDFRSAATLWLALLPWIAVASSVAAAAGQEFRRGGNDGAPPRRDFGDGPPRREFGDGPPPFMREEDWPTEATVKGKGFLFIDGAYVAEPYEIRLADDKLTVNGRELTCFPPPRAFGGRGFGPGRSGELSWRTAVRALRDDLVANSVVLSFAGQPYVMLNPQDSHDVLSSLVRQEGRSAKQLSENKQLPDGFDTKVWDEWIARYQPPDDLRQRAEKCVADYERTQERAEAEIRATQLLSRLNYPLTLASMILSVLAIGHLLGGRPHAGQPTRGVDDSPAMLRAHNWSLFFAAAFSAIDLTWTLAAANANQLHELNPIGSQWIEEPRHLAGFKISITFSALAILWLLRKHKRSQIAAWWICLVLTLLTIRWFAVGSLFMPI
jgi:hypothetical protein